MLLSDIVSLFSSIPILGFQRRSNVAAAEVEVGGDYIFVDRCLIMNFIKF